MLTINVSDEYRRLGAYYDALDAVLAWPDDRLFRRDAARSGWSPAQHLYHITLANSRMFKAIEVICAGHPASQQEGEPNRAGWYVLRKENMMRGRGQAPDNVLPPEPLTRAEIEDTRDYSRRKYAALAPLLPELPTRPGKIPHPFLGVLDASQWLRLARIHTAHHLAIIHELGQETPAPGA